MKDSSLRAVGVAVALSIGAGISTYSALAQHQEPSPAADLSRATEEIQSAAYSEVATVGSLTFASGPAIDGRAVDQQCVRIVDAIANDGFSTCLPAAELRLRGTYFSKTLDGAKTSQHAGFAPAGAIRVWIGGVSATVDNGIFLLDAPIAGKTVTFERMDGSVVQAPLG